MQFFCKKVGFTPLTILALTPINLVTMKKTKSKLREAAATLAIACTAAGCYYPGTTGYISESDAHGQGTPPSEIDGNCVKLNAGLVTVKANGGSISVEQSKNRPGFDIVTPVNEGGTLSINDGTSCDKPSCGETSYDAVEVGCQEGDRRESATFPGGITTICIDQDDQLAPVVACTR